METVGTPASGHHIERPRRRDVFTVPAATWDDRVTAAAMLLKIPHPDLVAALEHLGELTPGATRPYRAGPYAGEPDEDDVDADFFAEAKRARRKK
jgi:hypothetical protein